jgi:hypothetical protein
MLIFKAEIDFSSRVGSCKIVSVLEMSYRWGVSSHTQHKTMTILKSSIPAHGIDAFRNQFHNGIDFPHGIGSV